MTLRTWGSTYTSTYMYFCDDVVLKPDHDEQWPSFLRFRISRRYRLCYKGHKEKGHLMKNMVFPKLGTEEYRKLYCCYTNPVYSYITPNKPRLQHNYMYIFTTNRVINTYVLKCEQTRKTKFLFSIVESKNRYSNF